jgi:hypothetical protein
MGVQIMKKILIPTSGPDDWRWFLAEPDKQWKRGHSARALAHCWEEARDIPEDVQIVLSKALEITELEALICIPEHQVPLPGGSTPSQNDVWVLGKTSRGLISIAVEGKVSESFGPTIGEWFKEPSRGKEKRLSYLCEQLEVGFPPDSQLRYQLFHRTASAIVEAKRFDALDAAMVVHTFSPRDEWFDDYAAFLKMLGLSAGINEVASKGLANGVRLHLAWVHGSERWLQA